MPIEAHHSKAKSKNQDSFATNQLAGPKHLPLSK